MEVLLTHLSSVDPSFARWFRQGRSRKDALRHPIEPQRAELEKLIRRGKDRQFDDLGFRISGWNGASDDAGASSFDVTCGGYSDWVNNFCFFSLPRRGQEADRVLSASVLAGLVRSLAVAWEPDWAVTTSEEHRDKTTATPKPGTFVGWLMYFSRQRGTVPPLPAPVRIEPVQDQGTLIILTPERFTASNPGHVALAARVHELLEQAGLTGPLKSSSAVPTT
jgi:hypothetical protein